MYIYIYIQIQICVLNALCMIMGTRATCISLYVSIIHMCIYIYIYITVYIYRERYACETGHKDVWNKSAFLRRTKTVLPQRVGIAEKQFIESKCCQNNCS